MCPNNIVYECIASYEPIPPTLCAASEDVYQRRATSAKADYQKADSTGLLTDRLKELDIERKQLGLLIGWELFCRSFKKKIILIPIPRFHAQTSYAAPPHCSVTSSIRWPCCCCSF